MTLLELHDLISAIAPIAGIDSEGNISFLDDATQEQREQAQAVMDENIVHLTT